MSYSGSEDDPPVYESSGDEWDESMEITEKKRNTRRSSRRLSKKPRIVIADSTDTEEEEEDEDEEIVEKSVNGVNKRKKPAPKISVSPPKSPKTETTPAATKPASTPSHHNFNTGTFVILKKDAREGSPTSPPCIWKIDGKALLQKYEPFEEDGKVRHRNTSIYTGWSALDKDEYASVQVQVFVHSGQKMIVELDWDQLKAIEKIEITSE